MGVIGSVKYFVLCPSITHYRKCDFTFSGKKIDS